jgi:glyoxalase/bleomycin resistance protein/dioxygenase superfamily protein
MIKGIHSMFYSSQAEELRAFLRDILALPFTDVGGGWLIFEAPEVEVGVHPSDDNQPHARPGAHDISFYCDDVGQTVSHLKDRGVEFTDEVSDQGYGLVTHFKMPGDVTVQLYQPHYTKALKEPPAVPVAKAAARKKRRKPAKAPLKKAARKKSSKKKSAKKAKRRGGKR